MSAGYHQRLADLWCRLAKIERSAIFGAEDDRWLPQKNREHAFLPALGWVGQKYSAGGLVILGANPGGGGDSYLAVPGDKALYDGFLAMRNSGPGPEALSAFRVANTEYIRQTTGHNISLPISRILESANLDAMHCAFLNVIPFRTRNDGWPSVNIRAASVHQVLKHQLDALQPGKLVLLGMKAVDEYERHLTDLPTMAFRIPRRIGDRSIHPDALLELKRLQQESINFVLGN